MNWEFMVMLVLLEIKYDKFLEYKRQESIMGNFIIHISPLLPTFCI